MGLSNRPTQLCFVGVFSSLLAMTSALPADAQLGRLWKLLTEAGSHADDAARMADEAYRLQRESIRLQRQVSGTERAAREALRLAESGVQFTSIVQGDELGAAWITLENEILRFRRLGIALEDLPSISSDAFSSDGKTAHLLLATASSEDDFAEIYGRSPTASELEAIGAFNERVSGAPNVADSFDNIGDGDLVVILGHSEERGRFFLFPDGKRYPAEFIHLGCLSQGYRCVLLTCDSADLQIEGSISMNEALAMWESAHRALGKSDDAFSADTFIMEMRRAREMQNLRRKLYVSGIAIAGTGGVAYTVISQRDDAGGPRQSDD